MGPAIDVQHVAKTYRGILRHKPVLEDLSLTVERGEVYGLIGPNGAGKTTLMMLCLGMLFPDKGQVSLLDLPPDHIDSKRRIGYVPENVLYYQFLSGRRFLDLCGEMSELPKKWRRQRAIELAERLGIADALGISIRKYSRGMLQKLSLVQAALHDPEIYFLDEPTSGMDPLGVRSVRDFIIEQRTLGRTFFINSHQLTEVERVSDRVAIMKKGAISEVVRVHPTGKCVLVSLLNTTDLPKFDPSILTVRGLPASVQLSMDDGHLRLEALDDAGIAAAITAIAAAGLQIRSIQEGQRSLEDAFFLEIARDLE